MAGSVWSPASSACRRRPYLFPRGSLPVARRSGLSLILRYMVVLPMPLDARASVLSPYIFERLGDRHQVSRCGSPQPDLSVAAPRRRAKHPGGIRWTPCAPEPCVAWCQRNAYRPHTCRWFHLRGAAHIPVVLQRLRRYDRGVAPAQFASARAPTGSSPRRTPAIDAFGVLGAGQPIVVRSSPLGPKGTT